MQVLAGDWPKGSNVTIRATALDIRTSILNIDTIPFHRIAQFEIVSEINQASIAGKLGWGAAGALVLGPVGLLAGVLGGGNKKERVMSIKFKDGKKVLLKGGVKEAEILTAASF